MPTLTLTSRDFLRGASVSKYASSGGFSPESIGIDISRRGSNLGLLRQGRSITEKSTGSPDLNEQIVAVSNSRVSNNTYYEMGSAGRVWEFNYSDSLGDHVSIHTTSLTHSALNSHSVIYKGFWYISRSGNIARWERGTLYSTFDNTWWTGTKSMTALKSSVPNIFFIFQGALYVTDGNLIHMVDNGGGTANYGVLTLPADLTITDVQVRSDIVLISLSKSVSISEPNFNSVDVRSLIVGWNGISPNYWDYEVPVDLSRIEALKSVGNKVFFIAGGDLYELLGYDYSLIYPSKAPSVNFKKALTVDGSLYYVGDGGIWCYDPTYRSMSMPIKFDTTTNPVNLILSGWKDTIDIWTSNSKFFRANTNNDTAVSFFSNFYDFGTPIYIKKVSIVFSSALVTNASYDFSLLDEKGTSVSTKTIAHSAEGAIIKKEYQIHKQVDAFQFKATFNHSACPHIKSIRIEYGKSERDTTK